MKTRPATSPDPQPDAPAPFDARGLRDAFGHFATGVAVVTACAPDGRRLGLTINSLSSLSLRPALLLWSIAASSRSHAAFTGQVRHFAVHVLGAHQHELCQRFHRVDGDRFEGVDTLENLHGVPLLPGCLARFECATEQVVAAGDHSIVIGRILDIAEQPGEPLLFHRGRFGQFRAGGR
ncbi:MAG: flavin reductase family protein [Pseudoxanthomonas sp.]